VDWERVILFKEWHFKMNRNSGGCSLRKRAIFLTVFLLPAAIHISFGADHEYSLDRCIVLGLERSPRAVNARRDQSIADERIGQAKALVFPHLSFLGEYTRLDELQDFEVGDETFEFGTLDNYSVSASVSQLLYAGGKVGAALRAGSLTRRQAEWGLLGTENRLVKDIRVGFHRLLLSKDSVKVMQFSVEQLKAFLRQTEQKHANGAAAEFDVITAKVRLANETPLLISSSNTYELAAADFKRLINLDDEPFEPRGELAFKEWKPDLEELRRRALVHRAELHEAEVLVDLRREAAVSAMSDGLPSLSAALTYTGANSYQFAGFEEEWEWHWNAGLALTWNFWDGGLTRASVRQKELELAKARTELDDFVKSIELDVTRAFLDMKAAREAVGAGAGNVELARKALEIAQARHKAGLSTYLEFTDANLALSRARLTHLRAMHDHMNAVAQLEYACGMHNRPPDGAAEVR
jgi:outer membrane protein TolC